MTTRPRRPKPRSQRDSSQEPRQRRVTYSKLLPPEERSKVTELFPKNEGENEGRKRVGRVVAGRPTSTEKDSDGRKLDDRTRIKVQLGKRWSQILLEVREGLYSWEEFAESLDPEELARGQLRDKRGGFMGRPPTLVPAAFHQACQRELHRRFNEEMRSNLLKATNELIELGMSKKVEPKDRIKVLTYVIERVMGKIPDKVEVKAADPWETIISDILTEEGSAGLPTYETRTDA